MMRALIPGMENAKTKATMTKLAKGYEKRADAGEARTPREQAWIKKAPARGAEIDA
jgi:hypothetical protein